jgi:hypothetical protein
VPGYEKYEDYRCFLRLNLFRGDVNILEQSKKSEMP